MKKTLLTLTMTLMMGALTLSAASTQTINPTVIKKVLPDYPSDCLRAEVQGVVIVEGLVTREGKLVGATAVESDNARLAAAAVAAVREWEFAPMMVDGEATDAVVRVPVRFELRQGPDGRAIGEALARN